MLRRAQGFEIYLDFLEDVACPAVLFDENTSECILLKEDNSSSSSYMWKGAVNRQPGYRARNLQRWTKKQNSKSTEKKKPQK